MRPVIICLFAFLFFNCGASEAPSGGEDTRAAVAPSSAPNSESSRASDPDPFPGKSMCDLLTPAKVSEIIGCEATMTGGEAGNSSRKQCNYSMCSAPMRVVAATLRWTTDGSNFRQIGPDQNPALVPVSVSGADASFYLEQGNRLTVYRGSLSLLINHTGGTQGEAIALAEAALAEM